MDFDVEQLDQALLGGSAVILVAVLAVRVSVRVGLPSLLIYLLLGVVLGTGGLGIEFDNAEVAHALGFAALIIILTEGGVTTSWQDLRPAMRTGALLATVGVAVGVGSMALMAHFWLGFSWELAVLLAAVTAPTDAAAVFSVLRRVPLPRRLTGPLEAESGLNDAPTVLLVILASEGKLFHEGVAHVGGLIVYELAVGVLLGLGLGRAGAWAMRRAALPASGLYPLTVLSIAILSYGVAVVLLHASGFAAVYAAALVLGNTEMPHRTATKSFIEGLGWLSQIGLFVMLGLLLSPDQLTWSGMWQAVLAGGLLALVARPLSVLASVVWARMPWPDVVFLSWAGLRGAVPVVLATIPLAAGVEGARDLFNVVFVLVVIDTLVTAPTLPWLARTLRLLDPSELRDLDIETAPLDRIAVDLLQIRITRRSAMHGVEVGELRLPRGASVTLVVRDGETKVPSGRTVLRRGDEVLVVTPRRLRAETEDRLRAVSLRGRLATWLE
ncbi:potassium/proton antiporter [Nocardioides marmoribigeumensis]|uniref:Cell volume regulation protein A n=1 Tax=Nocardioides marmoribigeumensis TaxID=433649 RepID=A0ABU2BVM8_9ACTN|nr:potassium/proton antiporter [Nocardioides marmoribigeumensis]MDR7362693.1 cell volume regulation protein A [Nocardioides marmoribigeumensis]